MVTGFNDNNEQPERESFIADVVVLIYQSEDDYSYGLPIIENAEIRLINDSVFFIGENAKTIETLLNGSYNSIVDIDSKIQGVDTTNYLAEIKEDLKVKEVNFI